MTRLVSERAAAGATANDTSVRTPSVAANRVDLERRMTPTSGWSFMAGVGKVHRGRLGRVASARGGGTGAAEARLGGGGCRGTQVLRAASTPSPQPTSRMGPRSKRLTVSRNQSKECIHDA